MTAEPMDRPSWHLSAGDLAGWLDRLLGRGLVVLAPVPGDPLPVFRRISSPSQVSLTAVRTAWSAREQLLPRTEELYSFTLQDGGPGLLDPSPPEQETVLFGVLSCDASGFLRLDETFLHGRVVDPLYAQRRERTTVVSLACHEAAAECFCTAVGGSPHGTNGVDLRLVPLADSWLATALSQKGEALADASWTPASLAEFQEALRLEEAVSAAMASPLLPPLEAWAEAFDDPLWREIGQTCLSCGLCASVCPSCTCFDVHHEGNAWEGRVIRSWDSCTFGLFTLHASGHNPRPDPPARYRQRLLHKFAYREPGGTSRPRCVGCGRCVAACPAGIDIYQAVRRLLDRSGESLSDADR